MKDIDIIFCMNKMLGEIRYIKLKTNVERMDKDK